MSSLRLDLPEDRLAGYVLSRFTLSARHEPSAGGGGLGNARLELRVGSQSESVARETVRLALELAGAQGAVYTVKVGSARDHRATFRTYQAGRLARWMLANDVIPAGYARREIELVAGWGADIEAPDKVATVIALRDLAESRRLSRFAS